MKKVFTLFIVFTIIASVSFNINSHASMNYSDLQKKIINQRKVIKKSPKQLKGLLNGPFNLKSKDSSIRTFSKTDFLYEVEPNNYIYNANDLPLNEFMAGMYDEYDVDVYRLSVEVDGVLAVAISTDDYSLTEPDFLLYDEFENLQYPSDFYYKGKTKIESYNVEPGEYYITTLDVNNMVTYDPYIITAKMLDFTPPSKPIVNPISDKDTKITGKAEAGSKVWVKTGSKFLNKGTLVKSNGTYAVSIKPLKAGTNVTVYAEDDSKNRSRNTVVKVSDKTPPKTLTVSKITSKTKTITGKTEASALVEIKQGKKLLGKATANNKGVFKINIKPQKKGTKLTISAKDKAKNTKTVTYKVK